MVEDMKRDCSEERIHVCDFNPLTKNEFMKLMRDAAFQLEANVDSPKGNNIKTANMLREISRRVYYSGETYREDPQEFYRMHSKPIEIWEKGNIPKIHRDIVEKCLFALSDLAAPIVDEIDGLLISKRWKKIPDSDLEIAILVEKRDSYLFVFDLITPLWKALYEFETGRMKTT